ncbi:MAG: PepSY-associated TM helix domain-containing protein [Pseudomonadota bacterium]
MNRETIKNATEAHGWVGLIISVPLFIIFWTGAITLFYPEVMRWASMPNFPLNANQPKQTVESILQNHMSQYDFDNSRSLRIRLPREFSPYIQMRIPAFDRVKANDGTDTANQQETQKKITKVLTIDPYSGELLTEGRPSKLANFFNRLHFSLKLPQGLYIVGLITFFFFVIVITGVVIQLKNLIRHFFLYRHKKNIRYKMNDLHNVFGVVSLPYCFMYALTGLMFNLAILYQIPTLFLMYQGDRQAMIEDVGNTFFRSELAHVNYPMPDVDRILNQVSRDYDAKITNITLYSYGDKNAVLQFNGKTHTGFSQNINVYYKVSDDTFPEALNSSNKIYNDGVDVLFSIHRANFAGLDLRFLYFILAIGVCGMIVAGNVLWIVKRQKKTIEYPKTTAIMRGLTLGGCMGVILASVGAFLFERLLPIGLENRSAIVELGFVMLLIISIILAFFNNNYKRYVSTLCFATSALLLLVVVSDFSLFGKQIWLMLNNGYPQTFGVSSFMLILGLVFARIGIMVMRVKTSPSMALDSERNTTSNVVGA